MSRDFSTDSASTLPHPWCGAVKVDSLDSARLRLILATILFNVVAVGLLSITAWSDWRSGLGLSLIDNAILLWFVITRADTFLARLLFYGLAVGYTELAADAWLVDRTHTLDYSPGGGPMIWRSPVWMPLAWEIITVQMSCLGLWLWSRLEGWGLFAIGVFGAANIPYYEQMARSVHWWQYRGCRMLSGTPYYVISAEFLIAIALTLLAKPILRLTGMLTTISLGVLAGLAIFVSCGFTYWLCEVIKLGVRATGRA